MSELILLSLSGLLGSSHCVGMCGGFALALSRPNQSLSRNLLRQTAYTLGRVASYALLGAIAGWCGKEFVGWGVLRERGGALLGFVAGALLLYQGLVAAGYWPRSAARWSPSGCTLASLLRPVLQANRWRELFVAGVATAFIPCGLLYAMLALSASSHSIARGAMVMIAFGIGTAPAMVITGLSGLAVPADVRRKFWRVAAWCLIATGILTLARGGLALASPSQPFSPCPFCQP